MERNSGMFSKMNSFHFTPRVVARGERLIANVLGIP